MAIIKINGVTLPAPSELSLGVQDISNAERNTLGNMIIERINTKQKIILSWKYLSAEDLSTVLTAVKGTTFSVTYLDPVTNEMRTASFYSGDRNMGYIDFIGGVPRYKSVQFNLVEV